MEHDRPGDGRPLLGEHSFRHTLPNTAERRDEVKDDGMRDSRGTERGPERGGYASHCPMTSSHRGDLQR
jgi:hypothetical protein